MKHSRYKQRNKARLFRSILRNTFVPFKYTQGIFEGIEGMWGDDTAGGSLRPAPVQCDYLPLLLAKEVAGARK